MFCFFFEQAKKETEDILVPIPKPKPKDPKLLTTLVKILPPNSKILQKNVTK
jgi:hypothetical protein